ncbi:helix-turn-helix domain-containing protein [Peribacillus glennii]|uniref:ArsR family transcriptional regulator n=1 Tax=Peribacillus glennii TaxID=2303991 RepID=A0A372L734_9BACI|nr:helix-turn-helix domain-containing protein [Peribacillus glennii]RFU60982.1 ArsR family transcriptional regulator [Peribacillus glennii]
MAQSKIKLILHPVRMKIIQSLVGGKELTVQQLVARIKDVPQATLYRHLGKLHEAEVIEVVQENHIRGTVEKVYALKEQSVSSQQEFLNLSREEHLELFLTFAAQLAGVYENYLNQEDIDLVRDGVSYRMANLYLSDTEFMEMVQKIGKLIQDAALNEPAPDRKARNWATIIIPESRK